MFEERLILSVANTLKNIKLFTMVIKSISKLPWENQIFLRNQNLEHVLRPPRDG